MVSRVIPVDEFDLVIFGGTGDLARRKIFPALYRRFHRGQIQPGSRIMAAARREFDAQAFREFLADSLREFMPADDMASADMSRFLELVHYVKLDATGSEGWSDLAQWIRNGVVQAYYFSVAPSLFAPLSQRLSKSKMITPNSRVVVEKPFGRDLETARALNAELATCFAENQIYRIDHYLGKETVQNLMAVRFGNVLFEPLWNAQYVDHVQITVAETVGVDGRGAYFDGAGTMRDMVQNHLMQLVCLIAMEPPSAFEPDAVRDEKLKVIRALRPVAPDDMVRGQYNGNGEYESFRDEVGNPKTRSESFVALRLGIANWRWSGVPFYLRTGKRLGARMSEIAVVFKDPPHSIFAPQEGRRGNVLAIRLQPDEGISMRVTIKEPGPGGMRLIEVPLDMSFAEALGPAATQVPDAYERLIMDVIRGNQTLFMRGDEVEAAWRWTDPIVAAWNARSDAPRPYDCGSSGPYEAQLLLDRDGRRWRGITV